MLFNKDEKGDKSDEVLDWEGVFDVEGVKRVLNFILSVIIASRHKGNKPHFLNADIAYWGIKVEINSFTKAGNENLSRGL
jgi:hypothetical protein